MSLGHILVLILVAAVAGVIAERLTRRALPYGLLGAAGAGFVGAWLMVDVLNIVIAPEIAVEGIPLLSAIIGAAIVVFAFSTLAGGGYRWRGFRRF